MSSTKMDKIKDIDVSNHKNFCPLPWMHLYKDTDHTVKLCCADKGKVLGDLRKNTLEEIRTSEEFIKVRQAFLNDERLDRCKDCWYKEDNGSHSLRKAHLNYVTNHKSYYNEFEPAPIHYLDYRTSNLCNLGCKICIPHFSSKLAEAWESEGLFENKNDYYIREGKNTKEYFLNFIKERVKFKTIEPILSENLKNIYFAGGEPILADEHWYIIEKLKEKKLFDTSFLYNTNFTLLSFKNKNLLEELKDFKHIDLSLSLDGIGKSFDYWRTGGKWSKIVENLEKVKEFRKNGYTNFNLGVSSAVGWMNFYEVFKLHKFLIENEYIEINENIAGAISMQPVFNLGINFEQTPPMFIPELLQYVDEYEQWIDDTFKEHKPLDCTSIIRNMISKKRYNMYDLKIWLDHNKKLDNYFGTDFKNVYNFKTENFSNLIYQFYSNTDIIPLELQNRYLVATGQITIESAERHVPTFDTKK